MRRSAAAGGGLDYVLLRGAAGITCWLPTATHTGRAARSPLLCLKVSIDSSFFSLLPPSLSSSSSYSFLWRQQQQLRSEHVFAALTDSSPASRDLQL